MAKHIWLGLIGVAIAGVVMWTIVGHNTVEAPMMGDATISTTSTPAEMLATSSEEVMIPPSPKSPSLPIPKETKPVANKGCVVGGCSGELCTEAGQDVASICIWREEFACYKNATCERQESGQCGWSDTDELRQCLVETESSPVMVQ